MYKENNGESTSVPYICMKTIKRIIRKNLPETNSSSSHSLVIDTQDISYSGPGSPYWDLPMDSEGWIHIPSKSFGREWDKFNSVLAKVQYACGLVLASSPNEYESHEGLAIIADLLKEVSGAKGVIFDWIPEHWDRFQKEQVEDPRELEYIIDPEGCDIDHQSCDLYQDVLESRETLKNFILNPRSTVFLGSDECDPDVDFFDPAENPEAIIQIDFGGPIGRIDIPVPIYPCDMSRFLDRSKEVELLSHLVRENGVFRTALIDDERKPGVMTYKGILGESYCRSHPGLQHQRNTLFWATRDLTNRIDKECADLLQGQGSKLSVMQLKDEETKIINQALRELPGEWIEVPFKIVTEKYGTI